MNLTRCNHGHFYDMDKFESCPHCKNNGAGAAAEATVGLTGGTAGATEPYSGNAGDVTVPVGMTSPLDEVNTGFGKPIDVTEEKIEAAFQKISNPNPFASAKNPGFQNFTGEDPTEPLSSMPPRPQLQKAMQGTIDPIIPQDTGKSLKDVIETVANATTTSTDDGKTIGFYDGALSEKDKVIDPVVGWLVCIKGDAFGSSFVLKSGKNFIGRDRKMDVALTGDKSVSRECHAIVIYDPRSRMFLVQPGTSRELFYLNDKVVLGVEAIGSHDILAIGKTELMFIPCCGESFCWEDQIERANAETAKEKK